MTQRTIISSLSARFQVRYQACFLACGLALLGSCSGDGLELLPPPSYLAVPIIDVAPDPFTPMAAEILVATDQPTNVSVRVIYTDGELGQQFTTGRLGDEHRVPVLGLRPGEEHRLEVTVVNEQGFETLWDETILFSVPAISGPLPPMEVSLEEDAVRTPGFVMFCASGTDPENGQPLSHISILDEQGELYWYHRSQTQITDLRRLRNGNLLYIYNNFGLREMSMTGQIVHEWWAAALTDEPAPEGAISVPIDTFHHEVFELPEGDEADFLVLSSKLHAVRDFPLTVVNPEEFETSSVVSDVICTMRRDGTIVHTWDIANIIDLGRLSYDSLGTFWAQVYGENARDWTHANAAIYNELHDEIIVSARHQEAVFAFGRGDGQLRWILGDHDQWNMPFANYLLGQPFDLLEPFEWSYHQHSPVITGPDTLMMFDNGNNRAVAPAEPQAGAPYSRAVEYRLDREAMTISQLWDYGGPEDPWYSLAVGDADPMPGTDNVLVTDGFRFQEGTRWARVFEVTRAGEIVFEAKVQSPSGTEASNWLIYRAVHIPTLP